MGQTVNKVYTPLFLEPKRYAILLGGRGAGRSYVASQYALANLRDPAYFRCAIMRFVAGDIRNSIYQDIKDRIEEQGLEEEITIRDHILTFKLGANSINGIGFRKSSSDQKSKLKSLANYNCIIIEEADEVSEEDFMQLDDSIRTLKADIKIILCLNPPDKNHWIIKRWFNLLPSGVDGFYRPELKAEMQDSTVFIHTTYRENIQNINPFTVNNWQRYKHANPDHYYNMIEGLVNEGKRGRIFKTWRVMSADDFEQLPYASFYGLDFGFSNDPAALVEIKMHNQYVWVRELVYERGLLNADLSKRMEQVGVRRDRPIYADSAEPKSIAELQRLGWHVIPATKGSDSVRAGINALLEKDVVYTEDSENIAEETQEYTWALDRNKEPTNEPIDDFNHAMDAVRYGVFTHASQPFVGIV